MGRKKVEAVADLIFLGSQINTVTAAMKLKDTLLGRIAMTDLGSALKHIDIILPTKVCMVKAMVSPVDT